MATDHTRTSRRRRTPSDEGFFTGIHRTCRAGVACTGGRSDFHNRRYPANATTMPDNVLAKAADSGVPSRPPGIAQDPLLVVSMRQPLRHLVFDPGNVRNGVGRLRIHGFLL